MPVRKSSFGQMSKPILMIGIFVFIIVIGVIAYLYNKNKSPSPTTGDNVATTASPTTNDDVATTAGPVETIGTTIGSVATTASPVATTASPVATTASCPSGFVSTTYNTTGCMLNPSNPLNITDFSSISSVVGRTFSGTNLSTNQQKLVNAFGNYAFFTQWYSDISGPMGGPIFSSNNSTDNNYINNWNKWVAIKSRFNNVSGFPNNYMNIGSNLIDSMQTIATDSGLSATQLATNLVASSTPINGGIWTVVGRSSQGTPSQYIMKLNIPAFAQYCTN